MDETIGLNNYFAETWVVGSAGEILVTDYAVVGDNYNIYDNGSFVATTDVADYTVSDPTNSQFTTDPNVAWANPLFAHASFAAAAGDLITIQAISIPTDYVDSTVTRRRHHRV